MMFRKYSDRGAYHFENIGFNPFKANPFVKQRCINCIKLLKKNKKNRHYYPEHLYRDGYAGDKIAQIISNYKLNFHKTITY